MMSAARPGSLRDEVGRSPGIPSADDKPLAFIFTLPNYFGNSTWEELRFVIDFD
jgi:hypothetical protein